MIGTSKLTNHRARRAGSALPVLLFAGTLGALIFLEMFVTFRGLSSPMGMDQAQLARQLANGQGFHTKVVRPYAWRLFAANRGDSVPPSKQMDIFNPPLQPLVLAPVFKVLGKATAPSDGTERIYLPDRVIACVALLFFLGSITVNFLTVRQLFDIRVAVATTLGLVVCQAMWDVVRSGLPQMQLLFLFSLAMLLMVKGITRSNQKESVTGIAIGIGLLCAAMLMTHWMAIWLVLGLACCAALFLTNGGVSAAAVCGPPLVALALWAARMHSACGDYLGAAKALALSLLRLESTSVVLRDFSAANPPVAMDALTRKVSVNLTAQISDLPTHLGASVAALLFFVSMMHTFRSPTVMKFRWVLFITWLCAAIGMAAVGLPERATDDNAIHIIFIALMSAYGFAFLTVLWGRVMQGRRSWWKEHGHVTLALAISAFPILTVLPSDAMLGLHLKGAFAHWPPYLPDRIAKLNTFTKDEEFLFSDAPWAVAWYADRHCVWLPSDRQEFGDMRARLEAHGNPVAGFLITPLAGRSEFVSGVFSGEYKDWSAQIFRGLVLGFGMDIMPALQQADFPYPQIYPLAGRPVGDRFIAELVFMTDKKRWE